MKNILLILTLAFTLAGCASFGTAGDDYIPIGPQDLSIQVKDYKSMPVYSNRDDIKGPWASIGLLRVKNLPNDRRTLVNELNRIKRICAAKGAQAIVISQYFDENADVRYPVTVAAYLVRYLDNVSTEDKQKMDDFARMATREQNAR